MKILAIDTSGQSAQAALVEKGQVLNAKTISASDPPALWRHSEKLLPLINEVLGGNDIGSSNIGAVAYTCGPGSFTGLRIGAAVALGLARGSNLPAVGVPTLDAMAYTGIVIRGLVYVMPMMDARRGQYYAAVYEAVQTHEGIFPKRVSEYMADTEEALCALVPNAVQLRETVDIAAVGMLAAFLPHPQTPQLLYIRAPEAVRTREKNATQGTSS
jgi:tRNA threonylcarbamoyl adenosine modification protein YeaZ